MASTDEVVLSENRALRVECEAQEVEIAQLKNYLHMSVTKPDLCFGQQRVTLNKCLNSFPEKAWQKLIDETPEVDSPAIITALEDQLADKNKHLTACLQEISNLRSRSGDGKTKPDSITDGNTAHLLSQITFLHNEVERLEQQVNAVRAAGKEELRVMTIEYNDKLQLREKENRLLTEQLRGRKNHLADGEDMAARTKTLESQLATALSEKSSLLIEKNNFLAKIRKLEAVIKERKNETSEALQVASQEHTVSNAQIKGLQEVIQVLSDERSSLRRELANLRSGMSSQKVHTETQTDTLPQVSSSVQTDVVPLAAKECQVDSCNQLNDPTTHSVQSLAHMLEIKCAECDDLRGRIDDISAIHGETVSILEVTKKRLEEEAEHKRLLSDDAEKLSLQVRSLQQKCSQYAASERELHVRLANVEDEKQQLIASSFSFEREKKGMEERLQQFQRDMDQLVANKNYCNQQVGQLANENEKLVTEQQRLLRHETQLAYSLKAKDGELQEVLSAYQNAVKEAESQRDAQRTIERELEVVRATLSSKEQSIIYLQEQVSQLHRKDQQSCLDLQTYEYENDQLHRKLVQSTSRVAQLETTCEELQQVSLAKDRAADELQQSLAELSKQLILKENECVLLQHRYESLQHDFSGVQSAYEADSRRCRELEDTNARLVVRGMLSSEHDEKFSSLQGEVKAAQVALQERESLLRTVQEQLQRERDTKERCMTELEAAQASLSEALSSKERLQQIVLDQAATLSHLSQ
ncbi:uncharacterized protein TEOVI_000715200 [Trypanosoma equiperdum]|uniref:Uncharacterized protein n=1 Tax=Trypanosoma equiperdum TaxID=5694 RepID=A0A1G4I3I0_TRYEQ|nr:hypothetical protein, conserved [Trypanosoma equiperdum]